MANPILVGTGFYSTQKDQESKADFFRLWAKNTELVSDNIVVVDNSTLGLSHPYRDVRIMRNLGHAGQGTFLKDSPMLGWSISWIIPAFMAYSDGCDFIYKEQDCLAFGDWLPIVRQGEAAFGRNSVLGTEASLFYLRHDLILAFVRAFMSYNRPDTIECCEEKFTNMIKADWAQYHHLPGGRDRPLPDLTKPFYAQRITPEEMDAIKKDGLL